MSGLLALMLFLPTHAGAGRKPASGESGVKRFEHIRADDAVEAVLTHPAFSGFSQFILPGGTRRVDGAVPLRNIRPLLPYHGHIRVETTVDVLNAMIDAVAEGQPLFHDFYTDARKEADPSRKATGLFFFRGKPGAPFAIVCPGGGFSYVGSIHEGFPQALVLSRQGYNAFVLKYRVGSGLHATEDLAAALSYVFENAGRLEVGTGGYSLWGGSAGARMAAYIGSHGTQAFGGDDLPGPASVILAYTGHSEFTRTDPPTFVMVSADDPIVDVHAVERRVDAMRFAGIDVEYHKYKGAGHGFGLGIGTDAEGWMEDAIRFWEKHLPRQP